MVNKYLNNILFNILQLILGWADIGYNFLVGEDGNIYTGRDWTNVGAHTVGYNSKSIGWYL
jgi:hypothetical protein